MLKPRRPRVSAVNVMLLVVLLALGGGAWLVLTDTDSSEKASSSTAQAQRTDVTSTVSADGTAGPNDSADVDFNTDGTIAQIPIEVGDQVNAGDALAYVSNRAAGQELTAAKADLRAAKANREAVEEETDDDTRADDISDEERDKQRLEAKASVEKAELAVLQAQESMDDLVLRSPVDGTVTAINGTVGSSTNGGSDSDSDTGRTFATISDLSSWVVACDFAEADVAKIEEGDEVRITFGAIPNETFTGKVRKIDLTATTSENVTTYGVEVEVVDAPSELRDGASASVTVTTASASNVLAVPTSAVTTDAEGQSTVKLVKDGKSTTRTVQIGIKGDIYTEIKSGLSVDDVVELGATSTSSSNSDRRDVRVGAGPMGPGGGPVVMGHGG
ncbi:MAG TPA: efflux RND transporter periplasmic adaptor subunit [Aeromicrobium sp.]|nr:efflux RND transporter periplasmic adaptor subunit [Aeromicrobium sp.]